MPILIVSVEDEVTGTGSLVNRLIFGVTVRDGGVGVLRDWELLQLLNAITLKSAASSWETDPAVVEQSAAVDRLKQAFDSELGTHAPTLRSPVSWPEMLLLPVNSHPKLLRANLQITLNRSGSE